MRKTALLTGVAGLFLMSAPAFAQDGTPSQTPPAADAGQAVAPTLTLQPGTVVRGSDGELGELVGARTNGNRQQLTVRGADGTVRAVPLDGIRQEGDVIVVDFSTADFGTADTVTQPAVPATPADPAVDPATPATPALPGSRTASDPTDDVDGDTDEDVGDVAEDTPPIVEETRPGATPALPAQRATPAEPGEGSASPAARAVPAVPPAQTPPTLPPGDREMARPGNGNPNPGKPDA